MKGANPPDFIVIGAMKAGTTTLFRWLAENPRCRMPVIKEPAFFADESSWKQGMEWYLSLFAREEGLLSGEASVVYTNPSLAEMVAERIRVSLPGVKLVFLAREPVARLRSHYRHEVQRHRETRSLSAALEEGESCAYVTRSMYSRCLGPFIERFPPERLHVAIFEDLYGSRDPGEWLSLLSFLGLPPDDRPSEVANITVQKRGFSRLGRYLWDQDLLRSPKRAPRWLKRVAAGVVLRDNPRYRGLLGSSNDAMPESVLQLLDEDRERFLATIGRPGAW